MADNTPACPLPNSRLPVSGVPFEGFGGYKCALTLGLVGAGASVLFIWSHWSIALVAAVAVLVLSAVENEPFLLFLIFAIPLSWSLGAQGSRHDVPSAVHCLAIVGFFLGRLWRGRLAAGRLLRSSLARASLLLIGAIVVSVILGKGGWTRDSAHSVYTIGSYVGFFLLVLAWADSAQRVQKILRVLLYSTIATAVFAILQEIVGGYTSFWLYLNPPGDYTAPGDYYGGWQGRAPSFLNYGNCLAGYLNLVFPFALACYVLGWGKWKKLSGWMIGLGPLALLSTQSIGGLLGFVAILILAIFYFVRTRRKKLALLAGICLLVLLLYVLRDILNPTHRQEAFGPDVVTRLLLWNTAWGYFVHSPVFGVGWGNFVNLYGSDLSSFSDWITPGTLDVNNTYLKFLAETGLVGFSAFCYFVVQCWRQARSQWRSSVGFLDKALAFGVLGALLSLLVHGLVDVLLSVSPQFGTLFWLLLGLLVANARLQGMPAVDTVIVSRSNA